jgi:hypothetical protein
MEGALPEAQEKTIFVYVKYGMLVAPVIVPAAAYYDNVVQIGGCERQPFERIVNEILEDTWCQFDPKWRTHVFLNTPVC